ncbi:MAG: Glu/Leu/Phe/Val family dehydrogenase [Oceanococcus sp.]
MTVFKQPAFDQHEAVHFINDAASGLKAIIAVHSTALGPAAGGCRMWAYVDDEAALHDVLRLSRGMSYKNAMADIPMGGGKAVIIGDAARDKSAALFAAYGQAIDQLGGQYVTAEDVGISVEDMAIVAKQTQYVSGLPRKLGGAADAGGDPSPKTARGVFYGIQAAVHSHLGRDDLQGLRVAVQGLGNVGLHLCRNLHAAGAQLCVADIRESSVRAAQDEFSARAVSVDEILFQEVDVIAPCALGGILNASSIDKIQARVVAGGANNQLQHDSDGRRLMQKGILYAPDYVINAGGIINVAAEYLGTWSDAQVDEKVVAIGARLTDIFDQARHADRPPNEVADECARQKLGRS